MLLFRRRLLDIPLSINAVQSRNFSDQIVRDTCLIGVVDEHSARCASDDILVNNSAIPHGTQNDAFAPGIETVSQVQGPAIPLGNLVAFDQADCAVQDQHTKLEEVACCWT